MKETGSELVKKSMLGPNSQFKSKVKLLHTDQLSNLSISEGDGSVWPRLHETHVLGFLCFENYLDINTSRSSISLSLSSSLSTNIVTSSTGPD